MLNRAAACVERGFLPLAVGFSLAALLHPPLFTWLAPHIPLGLGIIMFGMGMSLEPADFKAVLPRWPAVLVGAALQFGAMPLLAWATARALHLPPEAALGLVLVGACPGGTASNVIAYLSRSDTALSVVMTFCSTALAPILTPTLVHWLEGARIAVDWRSMAESVFWITAFPLFDGLILRRLLRHRLTPVLRVFPSVSILTISAIIACVVGLNQATILALPWLVALAVVVHNLAGFGAGYGLTRLLGFDRVTARTVSIEVGMQNSGLGVALAGKFFGAAHALPGALFSLQQNLVGIVLARLWSRGRPPIC
ncbi:bile acid:sodium symporter family protein [Desulfohalovibrio reitneri]|uniref:bile acid:sodium symporter family protein n=1 Tax=Desulfohalovibrio reitneri TaxID=1307759 RepID=UPI0005573BFD|nr:bile acid:sodium symporter family protein [Desulfohalovibrio reitneri]